MGDVPRASGALLAPSAGLDGNPSNATPNSLGGTGTELQAGLAVRAPPAEADPPVLHWSPERVAWVPGVHAHIPWASSDNCSMIPSCLSFDAQPCNEALL